jgi:pimeloyl-ACP methyl ester carboxylesterase
LREGNPKEHDLNIQTGFVEVSGARLFYKTAGDGRSLVFCHAGLVDHRMWNDQFSFFAKHSRVVCFDHRGFGKSDIPKGAFSPTEDLRGLLDHLGIRSISLVGLSMGGSVAIDFTLEHPERVNALILSGPSLSGHTYPESLLKSALAFYMTGKEKGIQAALRVMQEDPFWQYVYPSKKYKTAQKKFFSICEDNSQIFRWDFNMIGSIDPPAIERLDEIRVPTLIIAAEGDLDATLDVMDVLATQIEGAEKVVIKDSSHMVNMEHPEEFNRIILEFLEGLERRK